MTMTNAKYRRKDRGMLLVLVLYLLALLATGALIGVSATRIDMRMMGQREAMFEVGQILSNATTVVLNTNELTTALVDDFVGIRPLEVAFPSALAGTYEVRVTKVACLSEGLPRQCPLDFFVELGVCHADYLWELDITVYDILPLRSPVGTQSNGFEIEAVAGYCTSVTTEAPVPFCKDPELLPSVVQTAHQKAHGASLFRVPRPRWTYRSL